MIRTGIIEGTTRAAGELFRLLINHPDVEIGWVQSSANAGRKITDFHRGLLGESYHRFIDAPDWDSIDVVFLCSPTPGDARRFLAEHDVPERIRIIDMTRDHLSDDGTHDFVYGLPELNRKPMVRGARHVANPGSFATVITLALLPLAKELRLDGNIHVTAIAGSTDAEVETSVIENFSWLNDNITVVNALNHPQVDEVTETIKALHPQWEGTFNFIPMLGSFSRGIMAVLYLDSDLEADEAQRMFEEFYSDHNFTFVTDKAPDLKDVVNTNKCIIHIDRVAGKLVITAVIDNLLKGAAGTAVHNMNLLFGLQERVGLLLKASAF